MLLRLFLTIVISSISAFAGDDYGSISTSRPGVANPTSAIPTGLYQFEIGTNLTTSPGIDTTISIPMLVRNMATSPGHLK